MAVNASASPQLWAGKPIELVRWRNTRDGWVHDLIRGQYAGRDRSTLRIVVDGELQHLDRTQWEVCTA